MPFVINAAVVIYSGNLSTNPTDGLAQPIRIKSKRSHVWWASPGVVNEVEDVAIVERHLWLDGVVWDPV